MMTAVIQKTILMICTFLFEWVSSAGMKTVTFHQWCSIVLPKFSLSITLTHNSYGEHRMSVAAVFWDVQSSCVLRQKSQRSQLIGRGTRCSLCEFRLFVFFRNVCNNLRGALRYLMNMVHINHSILKQSGVWVIPVKLFSPTQNDVSIIGIIS